MFMLMVMMLMMMVVSLLFFFRRRFLSYPSQGKLCNASTPLALLTRYVASITCCGGCLTDGTAFAGTACTGRSAGGKPVGGGPGTFTGGPAGGIDELLAPPVAYEGGGGGTAFEYTVGRMWMGKSPLLPLAFAATGFCHR